MPTADLVLIGARVRTLDPARPRATALAVKGGLIAAVGDDTDALDWQGNGTRVVDLAGATLVPGLTDAHAHPLWGLDLATGTDLSAVTDLDGLRAALRAAPLVDGWVLAYGLDHNVFGGRALHHELIDEAVSGAPAHLRLYDAHSVLVSRAALELAGIDGPREFAQRAAVVCDADGRPTGHLVEHAAMELMTPLLPATPPAVRAERLLELLSGMAATGLTGAHVMDVGADDLDLLTAVEDKHDLPVRLRLAPWCMPGDGPDEFAGLIGMQQKHGRTWRVGGVKLFMDGTVEGGTAWLEHADCHGEGTDAFWLDPADYRHAVRTLHQVGVPTATHAIGDAAVRHVLDTIEELGAGGPRHRVEHIETLADDQVGRFARLGVAASMQPPHTAYTRADHTDEWSRRLGDERAARAWRCRDLREAGATLALGSDWPIAHYDARQILAAAREPRGAATGHGLSGLMALEGCTSHAALASSTESVSGRIAPGFQADLTALTLDPVTAPADELAESPVTLTMTGGRVVFERP
ncbi:amidohydrolase [Nonomuraea endophytica]|uniref:amidohydrolase n=1 Tax=Nonomuraea endophytica TaxID=714136 RepID=UPI0037C60933